MANKRSELPALSTTEVVALEKLKNTLRQLKKLEIRLRFGVAQVSPDYLRNLQRLGVGLIWDEFFDLSPKGNAGGSYTLAKLLKLDREAYRAVLDEYFTRLFESFCSERGHDTQPVYDAGSLLELGLPADAGYEDIKRRFRELAKLYHPDTGGDSAQFIQLMESYRKLLSR